MVSAAMKSKQCLPSIRNQLRPFNPLGLRNEDFKVLTDCYHHLKTREMAGISTTRTTAHYMFNIMFRVVVFRLKYSWDAETRYVMQQFIEDICKWFPQICSHKFTVIGEYAMLSGIRYLSQDFGEMLDEIVLSSKFKKFENATLKSNSGGVWKTLKSNNDLAPLLECFKNERYPPFDHIWWRQRHFDVEYSNHVEATVNCGCTRISQDSCKLIISLAVFGVVIVFVAILLILAELDVIPKGNGNYNGRYGRYPY